MKENRMGIELSDNLNKQFEAEVHHCFQSSGKLRNSVRIKAVKGSSVQFPVANKPPVAEKEIGSTVIQAVQYDMNTTSLHNYTSSELTDIFGKDDISFDEREDLVKVISNSLSKRLDQIIIDALNTSIETISLRKPITVNNIKDAARLLNEREINKDDRTLVIHVKNLHELMNNELSPEDFNSLSNLVTGNSGSFYGFNVITINDMAEGGLSKTDETYNTFIFSKDAVGVGVNLEKVEVNYEPTYGAWRVTGFLSAGAAITNTDGVIKISREES